MDHTEFLLPMLALIGWTLIVLLGVPIQRFKAAKKRTVTAEDFKYGESLDVPGEASLANRNFMNLLEVPLLFYVVSIIQFITNTPISYFLILSWIFVALRVIHSFIHLTYNNVIHRMSVFALSNIALVILWGSLSYSLV